MYIAPANQFAIKALRPRIPTSTARFNKTFFKSLSAFVNRGVQSATVAARSRSQLSSARKEPTMAIVAPVRIDADG
jgi:hypothetical protein